MSIDFEPGETAGSPGLTINVSQAAFEAWRASGTWVQFAPGRADPATFLTHGGVLQPPADWAAKECENCRGTGVLFFPLSQLHVPCPDCDRTGKRRLPVTVPCQSPWCDGEGRDRDTGYDCHTRITVAWATVEWVAPVHGGDLIGVPRPVLHVYEREGRWLVYLYATDGRNDHHLHLPPDIDPASLIGLWAIGGRIEVAG